MDPELAPEPRRRRSHLLAGVTSLLFLLPLAFAFLRPTGTAFTVDEGNKALLTRAAAENPLRPELPYLGRMLDPDLRWVPIGPPFAYSRDRRLLSQYPPAFSVLSVPGLALLGYHGLFLLPWFGLFLSAFLAARLAQRCGEPAVLAAILTGPASVLYPYGGLFWEHTLAAAAVLSSLIFLCGAVRRGGVAIPSLLLAGASLGLGAWFREEIAVLFLLLLVLAMKHLGKRSALMGLAFVVAWVPFLIWQAYLTGTPWGFHVGNVSTWSGLENWLRERGIVLASLLVASSGSIINGWIQGLAVLGTLALALRGWIPHRAVASRSRSLLVFGVIATMVAAMTTLISIARAPSPSHAMIQASGLLLFVPWIGLAFANRHSTLELDPASQEAQCRALTAQFGWLGTLLLLVLTPSITAHGVHWGPRVLLSLAPIWAVLATASFRPRDSIERAMMLALILVSVAFQIGGLALHSQELRRIGQMEQRVRKELATLPKDAPVVTHLWWYAQMLPELYASRPMFAIRSREDLEAWVSRFAGNKEGSRSRTFAWVTDAPTDDILNGLPLQGRARAEIVTPGFGHRIVILELLAPDSSVPGAAEAWKRLEELHR